MKIKITKQVEVEDYTEQFVSKLYGFLEDHFIAKIDENEYAIVSKENNIPLVQFQSVEKITKVIWILNINDNEKRLIDISKPTPTLSEPFSKVIKIFEGYILVEYEDEKRDIIDLDFLEPPDYGMLEAPYSHFRLPNGKFSFVNMNNLKVSKDEIELKNEDFF